MPRSRIEPTNKYNRKHTLTITSKSVTYCLSVSHNSSNVFNLLSFLVGFPSRGVSAEDERVTGDVTVISLSTSISGIGGGSSGSNWTVSYVRKAPDLLESDNEVNVEYFGPKKLNVRLTDP